MALSHDHIFVTISGTVLLDLELYDLPSIAEAVVENMVITDQLSLAHYTKVIAALLLKHKHQYQSRQPVLRRLSSVHDFQKMQENASSTSLDQIPDDTVELGKDSDVKGTKTDNSGGGGDYDDDEDEDDGVIRLRIDKADDVTVAFIPESRYSEDKTDCQVSLPLFEL